MNIQSQRSTEIPGLFSSDHTKGHIDWSNDSANQEQRGGADAAVDSGASNAQSQILLGGKSLLSDLTLEKDNLDTSFVHSHRLLDSGG